MKLDMMSIVFEVEEVSFLPRFLLAQFLVEGRVFDWESFRRLVLVGEMVKPYHREKTSHTPCKGIGQAYFDVHLSFSLVSYRYSGYVASR